MEIYFRGLPGRDEPIGRPVVDIHLPGVPAGVACLLDTGTRENRFGQWVADLAGIDTADAEERLVGVGGHVTVGRTVEVDLRLGEYHWCAPVSFCDPWPWDFHLLGQEGFLRFFDVCISAAALRMEIVPAAE